MFTGRGIMSKSFDSDKELIDFVVSLGYPAEKIEKAPHQYAEVAPPQTTD